MLKNCEAFANFLANCAWLLSRTLFLPLYHLSRCTGCRPPYFWADGSLVYVCDGVCYMCLYSSGVLMSKLMGVGWWVLFWPLKFEYADQYKLDCTCVYYANPQSLPHCNSSPNTYMATPAKRVDKSSPSCSNSREKHRPGMEKWPSVAPKLMI